MTEYALYSNPKGDLKTKDRADLLEAFLGALYVDQGLEFCIKFCEVCFFPRLQSFIMHQDWNDPKSKLQQCCLTLRTMEGGEPEIPSYKVIECMGPTNTRIYTVAVYFKGRRLAKASGHSIQHAEMNAAKKALDNSKDLFPQLDHQKRVISKSMHRQKSGTNTNLSPANKNKSTKSDVQKGTNCNESNLPLAYQRRNRSVSPENSNIKKEKEATESGKTREKPKTNSVKSLSSEEDLQQNIHTGKSDVSRGSLRNNSDSRQSYASGSKQTNKGSHDLPSTKFDYNLKSRPNSATSSVYTSTRSSKRVYEKIAHEKNQLHCGDFSRVTRSCGNRTGGQKRQRSRSRSRSRSIERKKTKTNRNEAKSSQISLSRTPIPSKRTKESKSASTPASRLDPLDFLLSAKKQRSDKVDTPGLLMDLMFSKSIQPNFTGQKAQSSSSFNGSPLDSLNQSFGSSF